MSNLNPYLLFNGNAADAITFYQQALGATVEFTQHYANAPFPVDENWKQKILHATLMIHQQRVMISDSSPDIQIVFGDNVHLALNFETDDEMEKKFNALAAGGTVKMPLQKTFWAEKFGMLVDQFGIHWMFNYDES